MSDKHLKLSGWPNILKINIWVVQRHVVPQLGASEKWIQRQEIHFLIAPLFETTSAIRIQFSWSFSSLFVFSICSVLNIICFLPYGLWLYFNFRRVNPEKSNIWDLYVSKVTYMFINFTWNQMVVSFWFHIHVKIKNN